MDRQDLDSVRPTLGEELRSSALLFGLAIAITAGVAGVAAVTLRLLT